MRDKLIAILKSSSEPKTCEALCHDLGKHSISISRSELKDIVYQYSDVFEFTSDLRVKLKRNADTSHVRTVDLISPDFTELEDVAKQSRMHRMIRYYEECLREEGKSVEAYREAYNNTFIFINSEPSASYSNEITIAPSSDTRDFYKKIASEKSAIYYGYPQCLKWIESKDGEFKDYKVVPVFIYRLELVSYSPLLKLRFLEPRPRLNPALLKLLKPAERAFAFKALDLEYKGGDSLYDRVKLLESVLDFKVCEPLTPHELKVIPDLSKIGKGNDGLYNRGAIYLGTPNMYIMGLTKELNNIFNRPESELASTALKNVLYPADDSCQIIDSECKDVYDVGGLNYYQRRAIQIADTAPLTVVTGPPGTGKSQVVIALIVNAILTGKKVLFASRNQQAVNVVEERVNSLVTDIPAMIRVGSAGVDRKADRELIEACSRIINVSNSKKVDRTQLLQESISRQFKVASKLDLELRNIADILSEVNDLDRSYHTMKNDLFPLEEELSVSINKLDFKAVTKYMRKLKFAVTTASGLSLIEPQMFKLLNSMNHQVFDSLMENIKKLEIPIEFSYPSDVASGEQLLKSIAALARFIDTSIKMKEASLKLGEAAEVEELYSKLNSSRSEVLDLTREYVEEFISNKVTSLPDNKLRELHTFTNVFKDIMSDKTGGVRLKKMQHSIKELFTSVMDVFPAWAVTNLSINKRIPLAPGIFDMVIIDEASQCDIASVLPLLYRSKQAVIIGDPLQLQHIVNLDERAMQQLKMKYQLNDTKDSSYSYTTQSIYDAANYAAHNKNKVFLASHYRCHPDIVNFCNNPNWYNGKLEILTDIGGLNRPKYWQQGITWIDAKSECIVNGRQYWLPNEIEHVVSAVEQLLIKEQFAGSIGVVAPMKEMAKRIEDAVSQKINGNLLAAADFRAATANAFQGAERDVIVYSMSMHESMTRGASWFIGENKNLFNVALSRARAAFICVGDKEFIRSGPISYLSEFVTYTDKLESDLPVQPDEAQNEPIFEREQIWEEKLYNALKKRDIQVISQYPVGPYKLDFALLYNGAKLDIEVDGERWHKDSAGKRLKHDIDRDIYTKSQGWSVLRFWVYELREDMEKCLSKIEEWKKLII